MKVRHNPAERRQDFSSSSDAKTGFPTRETRTRGRRTARGIAAVEQARLIMLVMLNVAQLWILAATVEAALAQKYKELWPLVGAAGVCCLISISIIIWWRPASRRYTSTGYIRDKR